MLCYSHQFKHNQNQEALMKNVVDSLIASIIFGLLSTGIGLILQALGFSTQASVGFALIALLLLVLLFLGTRTYYSLVVRRLTETLLEKALHINATNESDEAKLTFKRRIIERVLLEHSGVELRQNNSVVEFLNQEVCEPIICDAFRRATRKVKILTIRGERYFSGATSLLYKIYLEKPTKNFSVECLVLSPESQHITEELAAKLEHENAERIKNKMRAALGYLKFLASHRNFEVRCYNETPNFKILLFDDEMFVSSFAAGEP
jgi:hypothetical protein